MVLHGCGSLVEGVIQLKSPLEIIIIVYLSRYNMFEQ